ncbi:hypothetical protein HOU00_gp398 [Caulobacter phage CcrPW]|uniref:Uncharacterized protein n=1 Tax=Caulobacter phage CcrPW TaxID=2283271 RepID=A0A385ED32_9CAUD|nr:hypothetical protein HOU00_gp398 [Caulobacter phage CcrPW]AXQ68727.1 hypothetical protein CcrPW_gp188 [Caulobacter phage CcrPW]
MCILKVFADNLIDDLRAFMMPCAWKSFGWVSMSMGGSNSKGWV